MNPRSNNTTVRATLAIAAMLCSCGRTPEHRDASQEPASASANSIEAHAAKVEARRWDAQYEAIGSVKAYTASAISSKVVAYVTGVAVKVGDVVEAGRHLVTLDSRELDAALKQAQSHKAEVEEAIAEAGQGLISATAKVDVGRLTYSRMQELEKRKTISQQEFDECTARWTQAQAECEMARDKIKQLKSRLEQTEQELKTAEVNHGYAAIDAPFAGVVTSKPVEPGILASPGVPLIVLEKTDRYRLEVMVEENRLAAIRLGQAVPVTIEAAGFQANVPVSEMVPAVDTGSRSGLIKLDLPAGARWRSGQFGRARFDASPEDVLTVPADTVQQEGQIKSVQVVENSFLRMRLVTLGRTTGNQVEVLSGLQAGEVVLSPARRDLADGARVRAVI